MILTELVTLVEDSSFSSSRLLYLISDVASVVLVPCVPRNTLLLLEVSVTVLTKMYLLTFHPGCSLNVFVYLFL